MNCRVVIHGGQARSLINFRGPLIKALCDAGIEVHAVAPDMDQEGAVRHRLSLWGVITHEVVMQRTGMNPFSDLRALSDLYKLFKKLKPDVVLGYTIKPVIYGTLAAWFARVPKSYALITGLGYAFTGEARGKRGFVKAMARFLYALALSRADKVFFQNPDDEMLFRELRLLEPSAISLVVNGSGVDVACFDLVPLPNESLRFLLIARMLGDKGIREYVAAARQVRSFHPEVEFHLVGGLDPNPDGISEEEVKNWHNEGSVVWHGPLADVRPAIAAAHVYVLPSYREGTPRTVLEAMAMGRPVITTDAPGCRETVVDGDNGYLVPVRSVDLLVEAMLRFVERPELVSTMGARARQVAEEKYDVHKVNAVMLKAMGLHD